MRELLRSWAKSLVASAARTTDSNATFELPEDLHSAQFILDITAASGTSPTLDVHIETSPDAGTTYYTAFRFAQATAAAKQRLAVPFYAEPGNTGTTATNANSGNQATISATTTGALSTGVPVVHKYMRVRWDVGGTSPSFTFAIWVIGRRIGTGVMGY